MNAPIHTGTANLPMAATLAVGKTAIVDASAEPEVVWLSSPVVTPEDTHMQMEGWTRSIRRPRRS